MPSKQISSIGLLIVSEMTENPLEKYVQFWFRETLLINFRLASVIVLVAPNMAELQVFRIQCYFSYTESREAFTEKKC